ncbi:MAG: Crp/Fnr family transcriptional regulator [Deltaproteobacteria bacterium]|jgi:CRP-like cAMP-binding protein|nr:Crp/Fnr family transcriptional regulator [Deltaproteobacteria bacterium]
MKNNYSSLPDCQLFAGLEETNLDSLLNCLEAVPRKFAKGEVVFTAGGRFDKVGVVISGNLHIIREDFWGNRTILARIGEGNVFGESFSCAKINRLPVSSICAEATEVLLINYARVITTCSSACAFHAQLISNMLRILAQKNIALVQKIEHLTQRTTREKLLSYLSAQALEAGGDIFEIPFNRQELADYLAVERSAMSAELSKMRADNILLYHRGRFELLRKDS